MQIKDYFHEKMYFISQCFHLFIPKMFNICKMYLFPFSQHLLSIFASWQKCYLNSSSLEKLSDIYSTNLI
jgi:hypothetical protein